MATVRYPAYALLTLPPRSAAFLTLTFLLTACGDDPAPAVEVPEWAHVAPEQIAEAAKHRVPVAFENDLGMRFVLIPAGTFLMGSPEDEVGRTSSRPQHEVALTRPFYLQVLEAANKAYRSHRPDHDAEERTRRTKQRYGPRVEVVPTVHIHPEPYGPELNEDLQPVACVSRREAKAFTEWVTERDGGRLYRLPTEAEWEYACRAGTTTRTAFGGTLTHDQAKVGRDRFSAGPSPRGSTNPAEVGDYSPNRWGLYDMHGNVSEWCADWYEGYGPNRAEDPTGPPEGTLKVIRGGSARTERSHVHSARRWRGPPDDRTGWGLGWVGFRLVSPLPEPGER